jgi:hypothetical protein
MMDGMTTKSSIRECLIFFYLQTCLFVLTHSSFCLFVSTPTSKTNKSRESASKKKSTSGIVYDSDDGVLLSGFEEDSDVKRYLLITI